MKNRLRKICGNLYFTKGEEHITEHNAVTTLTERVFLSTVIGGLLSSSMASDAGVPLTSIKSRYVSKNSSNRMVTNSSFENFALYLLNLTPEEQAELSVSMKKNPILKANLSIDYDKIIGWCDFSYLGEETKKGVMGVMTPTYAVNGHQFGVSFNWAPGKLNGSFNTVILSTNATKPQSNITITKGLDVNNTLIGESSSYGYYLPNNIAAADGTVITGQNEILLGNGNAPQKARRVLNLLTGEETILSSSDVRYDFQLYSEQLAYIGDGRVIIGGSNPVVRNVDLASKSLKSSLKTFSGKGFAIHNNLIYICSAYSDITFNAYDMVTYEKVGETITIPSDSVPSYFPSSGSSREQLYLGNFMDKFVLFYSNIGGYIFSDLNDPFGSYEGSVNLQNSSYSNITLIDENEALTKYVVLVSDMYSYLASTTNPIDSIKNPSDGWGNVSRSGVKFIDEENYGSVLSYAILSQPITVSETEGLKLDYMFNF